MRLLKDILLLKSLIRNLLNIHIYLFNRTSTWTRFTKIKAFTELKAKLSFNKFPSTLWRAISYCIHEIKDSSFSFRIVFDNIDKYIVIWIVKNKNLFEKKYFV
jgi:hypothetical protein